MEINYHSQVINARMSLEEALNAYSGEVKFLTLRDGTNIEIISGNQFYRKRPEVSYTDNRLQRDEENYGEFVEENIIENNEKINYQQLTQKTPDVLRGGKGKNKGLGKSLRKTVLKSIDGNEIEKEFENGKLRNTKSNKPTLFLNDIIQFSDSNDFIQCANCHKFFASDEKVETENKAKKEQKVPNKKQNAPQTQQFTPSKKPSQQNFQQQFQPYPQQTKPHQQKGPHQQVQPSNYYNQPYPQYPQQKQNIPQKNQIYPPNMNMGFNQKLNQQQGFYQQPLYQQPLQFQHFPQGSTQHHHQKIPHPNQQRGNPQQFYVQQNMPGRFPISSQQMPNQFWGMNQAFRARKKEVKDDEYELGNADENINDEYNNYDNYNTENIYIYPTSAKKYSSNKKIFRQYQIQQKISHDPEVRRLTRNLSFGYKNNIPMKREMGDTDNNLTEYMNADNIEYYGYPSYQKKNMIPTGRGQKIKNHKVINVKITRNVPYQYQEYQDYEDYIDH